MSDECALLITAFVFIGLGWYWLAGIAWILSILVTIAIIMKDSG